MCSKCFRDELVKVLKRGRQNVQHASLHLIAGVDHYLFLSENTECEREREILKHLLIQLYRSVDIVIATIDPIEWGKV